MVARNLSVNLKDFPNDGAFGSAKRFLESRDYRRDVEVVFSDRVENLGMSGCDYYTKDVRMFSEDGETKGWDGCYGGSTAGMFASNGIPGQANCGRVNSPVPPNVVILEFTNGGKFRRAVVYVNPIHQTKMLPSGTELPERMLRILAVFLRRKPSYRSEELARGNVTSEELQELCTKKFLKPQNGKVPSRIDKYKYDLAGCQITTEGKNAARNTEVPYNW